MLTNWLNEDLIKATVLFETLNGNQFSAHGSGVLVNFKDTFNLVTCKHIVINPQSQKEYNNLFFTVNRTDGSKFRYSIKDAQEKFRIKWHFHSNPEIDLACTPIGIDQNVDDIKLIPLIWFEDFGNTTVGDDIFFLGYPFGLGTNSVSKNSPLARTGIISLKNDNKTFLIDANVYPGSSGSPVFYRPAIADVKTMDLGKGRGPKFIGMVAENLNYKESAINPRTGEPRIIFQENAGLGVVFSSELIREIMNKPTYKAMLTRAQKPTNPPRGKKV